MPSGGWIQRPAQHAAPIIGRMSKAHRLGLVLVLNLLLVAALVVVGVTAHSLGVLAAGSIISPTRAASAFR